MIKLFFTALCLLSLKSFAFLAVEHTPIAGGIAVIDLSAYASHNNTINTNSTNNTINNSNIQAFFGTTPLYIQSKKEQDTTLIQALVGLPLLTTTGTKKIRIVSNNKTYYQNFELKSTDYADQYITFKGAKKKKYIASSTKKPKKPTKLSNQQKAHNKRLASQRKHLTKARTTISNKPLTKGLFTLPATGIISSKFGLKRFYNGQPKRPHIGIDYANKINTDITAPANGKVILVGNFFYNGKAIFLDHGQGLISVFLHLNQILVSQGQSIKRGDLLGKMGQTGRATGSHLHWTVYLNTTAINPDLLLEKSLQL